MIDHLERFEPRILRLALGCLLILVVAGLVTRSLVPAIKSYDQQSHTLGLLEQVVGNETNVADEISQLQLQIADLHRQVKGDMASLPPQQIEAFIVERLQSISWRNNVELGALQPAPGVDTERYEELLFQVELAGGYFQLVDWLGDLASELGFVVVKEHRIALQPGSGLKPELAARLTLAAYRLGDDV